MSVFQGENGQGKSNLLEAIHILSVGKSLRARSDKEIVSWDLPKDVNFGQIQAVVNRSETLLKLQLDISSVDPFINETIDSHINFQKRFQVNGIPRKASKIIGELNAVLFTSQDLELVLGGPSYRRRFMDILLSQVDSDYLRSLQKYQRVVYQRNHLLRMIRGELSRESELTYWDEQLVSYGANITAARMKMIGEIYEYLVPIHSNLTSSIESCQINYKGISTLSEFSNQQELIEQFYTKLEDKRKDEITRGISLIGPHRDDLEILISGKEARAYASQGQARTFGLSLRLAEAQYLSKHRADEPVLLLDDVFSELDSHRRNQVLESTKMYEQVLITTTDFDLLDSILLSESRKYNVNSGKIISL